MVLLKMQEIEQYEIVHTKISHLEKILLCLKSAGLAEWSIIYHPSIFWSFVNWIKYWVGSFTYKIIFVHLRKLTECKKSWNIISINQWIINVHTVSYVQQKCFGFFISLFESYKQINITWLVYEMYFYKSQIIDVTYKIIINYITHRLSG